ncbi:MAG TPA: hypothetical protein VD994_07585 [Prosthecobacter sp.]|nr:hypothetical protein [Prosthecobacter sp.]
MLNGASHILPLGLGVAVHGELDVAVAHDLLHHLDVDPRGDQAASADVPASVEVEHIPIHLIGHPRNLAVVSEHQGGTGGEMEDGLVLGLAVEPEGQLSSELGGDVLSGAGVLVLRHSLAPAPVQFDVWRFQTEMEMAGNELRGLCCSKARLKYRPVAQRTVLARHLLPGAAPGLDCLPVGGDADQPAQLLVTGNAAGVNAVVLNIQPGAGQILEHVVLGEVILLEVGRELLGVADVVQGGLG